MDNEGIETIEKLEKYLELRETEIRRAIYEFNTMLGNDADFQNAQAIISTFNQKSDVKLELSFDNHSNIRVSKVQRAEGEFRTYLYFGFHDGQFNIIKSPKSGEVDGLDQLFEDLKPLLVKFLK